MRSSKNTWLAATAGALALWTSPGFAQQTGAPGSSQLPSEESGEPRNAANYLDLNASIGYSSNPFLRVDGEGSFFGRASARGVHTWRSEVSETSIAGYVEGTGYLNEYGVESLFAVDANHSQHVSERVTLFGSVGASGDNAGQLSSRFLTTTPAVQDPALPPPPTNVTDPTIFGFNGHQYRFYGQGGASIRTSERGILTMSAGASHWMYTSDLLDNYTTVFGNISYDHQLSERTTVGFHLAGEHTEYNGSDDSSSIITPTITGHTQLGNNWELSGSAGLSFSKVDRGGSSDSSTNLSLDAALCHGTEADRFCARAARYSQTSALASIVTTTSVGVDWHKRLDVDQTIDLSAGYVHYNEDTLLNQNLNSDYFRAGVSYSRRLNDRLFAGAEISGRGLKQFGPNPNADLSGSVFIRYRLGDIL